MPLGDRLPWRHKHEDEHEAGRERRLVRSGEVFTSDELAGGEVELELPAPATEPAGDVAAEPWAWRGKKTPPAVAERLRLYQEFVRSREGGA